jgi:ribosomal protein S18 acetylase RimI-like enzyme
MAHRDLFLRWQVNPAGIARIDRNDDAFVVEQSIDHHGRRAPPPVLLCMGSTDALQPLLADVLHGLGHVPHRVTIEEHAAHLLPARVRWERRQTWDWMWTTDQPTAQPGEEAVVEVDDDVEINALLDVANPESHGRPDGAHRWLGVRGGDGALLATGAVVTLATEVGHLRGISTVPSARRRGIGTALSARLTRLGLERGVCTLGVYTDNAVALGIYRRLGFVRANTFTSVTVLG